MIGFISVCVGPITVRVTYCMHFVWKHTVFLSGLPSTFYLFRTMFPELFINGIYFI